MLLHEVDNWARLSCTLLEDMNELKKVEAHETEDKHDIKDSLLAIGNDDNIIETTSKAHEVITDVEYNLTTSILVDSLVYNKHLMSI